MIASTRLALAAAAVASSILAASASAAIVTGPISSVALVSTGFPGSGTATVGTTLNRAVLGNDAGGVATLGSVTNISGSTNALFGKKDQASAYGVAKAPAITFSATNIALFGGISSNGDVSVTGPIGGVQSLVVNDTAVATASTPIPAALSTGNWGTAFDASRMTAGGTAFIVGRDAANAGNLIMGSYSGYAANGSGGTWAKALKAGDTIQNPDGTPLGTLAGGTSATTTFDATQLRATDVGGTPTWITRVVLTTGGAITSSNNSVVAVNGKALAAGSSVFRTGSSVPGIAGATFGAFTGVDIASSGNTIVGGNTAGLTTNLSYVAVDGAVAFKGGDTVAGVTLLTGTGLVGAVDVNPSGDYAVLWGTGSTNGRFIIFGSDQGQAILATQTVTSVGVDSTGDGIADASGTLGTLTIGATNIYVSPRYLGLDGAPSVDVYFGGNAASPAATGNAIFKTTVVVPEPAVLGLLAPVGMLLARRRNA